MIFIIKRGNPSARPCKQGCQRKRAKKGKPRDMAFIYPDNKLVLKKEYRLDK